MKTRTFLLGVAVGLLSAFGGSIASGNPTISTFSENSMQVRSARIVRAVGGGFYLTGMVEPSFGYFPARSAHVDVAAYGREKKLLAKGIDKIKGSELLRWHFRPTPRAPYTVFFPFEPTEIASVTIFEHN